MVKIGRRINCWEFTQCGAELGGPNSLENGPCPASTETRLNGVHGGKNGGRACWVVAGNQCAGLPCGTFAKTFSSCYECDFYHGVHTREWPDFTFARTLLTMLE
ncbi:MAG: hypothetical protein AUK47_28490 [Deltaproteobacteria bacterium CG2_30_63_29]|nr:MAG: hypothetical protein AUK47_28490 [Deltaproteobacteria bacterium CG2_30_63_29]PIV99560.1 MAG: hypothetical protein COW42_10680 [Deltaproteobacteria bacterium CG17_big_fil_post_rev_8_21_14_2_50_63_7]PJB37745.1 MAG: hypothetical protein CO108_20420 [Deltaproteobacteria bacterium CG_4_9_14_3_um_filter_63_12]